MVLKNLTAVVKCSNICHSSGHYYCNVLNVPACSGLKEVQETRICKLECNPHDLSYLITHTHP